MQHTHDRRVSGVRRVPVERLVDVCGAADPASAFQGRSVDVSCRGMQVRASHLPQLHAPIVVRFHEHGAEVIAEGEVAWRRSASTGGDFGVRFTALDSRSVQTLKALCGVAGLEELEGHTQPGGAVAPISTRAPGQLAPGQLAPGQLRELDHDTDPAPPAALGVRLHVAGLAAPLQARVKAQVSNRLELGSQLDFLRVGRALDVEDLAYGGRRTAYVEALDLNVDPKSRVPELVVSVRYAETTDQRGAARSSTPEPQRARSLARGRGSWDRGSWDKEAPLTTPPPTTPRPASQRVRTPAPAGLAPAELEPAARGVAELGSDDAAGAEERDTTPPPLPMGVERAERAPASKVAASAGGSSGSSKAASQPSDRKELATAGAKPELEELEREEPELDSTEVILARLDSLLRGMPGAARAAGERVAQWGGAASRGASWCLAQARRAVSTSRRPAAPRRRTAAAPRSSSMRSGPLRQSSQPSSPRPRAEDAAEAVRRRGTRTVLYSCLIALVAIGIGWLARPSRQPAPPAAAHVAPAAGSALAASAAPAATPAATSALSSDGESLPPPSLLTPRGPSASVAEEDNDKSSAPESSTGKPSQARGQSVAAGSDEFGQGRLHLPVIYRLRLDEPGGTLRGERTATGFEITIVGRRVLDSGNSIARRDSRIAKVSTQHGPQGTRVSFRFRDEIPAYKVRLRRDAVEFLISSS